MELSEQDQIVYLANLISIARIDGQLAAAELEVLESARKSLRAKKSTTKKAEAIAEAGEYVISPVGPFSVRVANLEDQIRTALADGPLTPQEQSSMDDYAKRSGITDSQLAEMIGEVESAQSAATTQSNCPNCGVLAPAGARFCPGCGNPVGDATATPVSYEIPPSGITVEFAESTATGFGDALAKVRLAPASATCIRSRKPWHMGNWPTDQIAEAAKLAGDLNGMRNRKVWVDGSEAKWEDVFGFVWCSGQREGAYRPIEYCFGVADKRLNIWGCKQAGMDWIEWANWLSYGTFDEHGLLKNRITFRFDKKRIRHELESNLYRFRFCPHLDFA